MKGELSAESATIKQIFGEQSDARFGWSMSHSQDFVFIGAPFAHDENRAKEYRYTGKVYIYQE